MADQYNENVENTGFSHEPDEQAYGTGGSVNGADDAANVSGSYTDIRNTEVPEDGMDAAPADSQSRSFEPDDAPTGMNNTAVSSSADNRMESSTYSWVSPKLNRGAGQETGHNPWSSQNGTSFWETRETGTGSGQTYGGSTGYYGSSTESAGSNGTSTGSGTYNRYTSAGTTESTSSAYAYERHEPDWAGAAKAEKGSRKKTRSTGRKWASLVAMAVVFGLIAGSVTYGVNYAANRIHPIQVQKTDTAGGSSQGRINVAETGRGSGNAATGELSTQGSSAGTAAGNAGSTAQNTGGSMTVADVAAEAMPSLVTISTMSVQEMQSFFGGRRQYEVQGAGTGVIIGQNDKELLIATNNHVVQGAKEVSIGFIDESVISATIKGEDADTDLAIVAVSLKDISEETMNAIKIAVVGDSDALVLGEQVVAIGNSLGYGQSVTSGYISAFDRTLVLSDGYTTFTSEGLIQTDAAINSGNSGGALLNMRGELIGINEAKSSGNTGAASVDNMGFAIPMSKATPILEDLMTLASREVYSEDEQGYLGVTCADVTTEYSQLYNMPVGVCFTTVIEGGPAEAAGILKGDVLTKVGDRSISTYEELAKELTYHRAGETVEVTVYRAHNGEYIEQTFTVTLGTKNVIADVNSTPEPTQEEESGQNGPEDMEEQQEEDSQFGQGGFFPGRP